MNVPIQCTDSASITVQELSDLLVVKPYLNLIDCREEDEFKYAHIDKSVNVPQSRFEQFDFSVMQNNLPVYIISHLEGQAKRACKYLSAKGFFSVMYVAGGLDAWSIYVNKKIPRY